ncbi:MAG: GNAT family N-acetyltransferase [Solirubrobacterales bacterium]|nr:GNAT family N-acetyltransferase [Solirubrobacterales bacterium]
MSLPPVEIRPYQPDDEDGVLRLLQAAFGGWPGPICETASETPCEVFRWKHMGNPFGCSVMMVAEAGGGPVGFAGWMRWRVAAGENGFEAMRCVDAAVDHGYRRRGIWVALQRESMDHFPPGAAFTFSFPNKSSRPGALKHGTREIGAFPTLVRLGAPLRTARRLLVDDNRHIGCQPGPAVDSEPVADALDDRDGIHDLLHRVEQPAGRLTTVKDLGYLKWRYASPAYRAICEHREGRLAGIAIFRLRPRGRAWVSVVCELLVEPGDGVVARRLLRRVVCAARTDLVVCHFPPGSTARRAALQSGFVRATAGPAPYVQLLTDEVAPDPTKAGSWAISLGDIDQI